MNTVEYAPEMGEIRYPEGFLPHIQDLPVEKQIPFFRTTQSSAYVKTNWSERTLAHTRCLEEDADVKALILKDGCIVGVMMTDWFSGRPVPVMPEQSACTYYASDNDGAGYNERLDHTFLVCVPERHI